MRLIVNFSNNTEPVPTDNQKNINSYIHDCLGRNNEYHNTPSDYSISKLLGSSFDVETKTLNYPNGGRLVLSSNNNEFLNTLLTGIMNNPDLFWGMKYINIDFINETFYDGFNNFITLSPILLKVSDEENKYKYITTNDPNFDEILTARTLKRLQAIKDKQNLRINLNGFKIVSSKNGKNKVEKITVKNVMNIASSCIITVQSNKKVAELLYNIGIGQSTGSGFGTICKTENISKYKRSLS